MAGGQGARPRRGLPFVGTVLAIQTAAPGQLFALAGFEATAVVQVALAAEAANHAAEQAVIVLYSGSLTGVHIGAVVMVYAMRAEDYAHHADDGSLVTWAVCYAHAIDHVGG